MKRNEFSLKKVLITVGALLVLSAAFSLSTGNSSYTLGEIIEALLAGAQSAPARVMLYVRLPRTLAALLAGAALSVAGALIQTVLDNPLAGPNIIGVNSGAGFFVVLCYALFPRSVALVPVFAFVGALAATFIIYFIARRTGASRITIVLAGIAVNSILNAGSDAVNTFAPQAMLNGNAFKVGGFAGVSMNTVGPGAIYIVIALAAALLLSHEGDVLSLGEDTARSLGMNTKLVRFALLAAAAVLAGAAVSFAGLLGFVGLIVPHCVRMFVSSENRVLLPACILYGSSFLIVCDTVSRIAFAPYELPVGILMSLLGGPFFIWLIVKRRGGRSLDTN